MGRWRHRLFGVYCAVCLGAVVWPGYAWLGNRIEPRILGLPFSLTWVIVWVLLTFGVLAIYDRTGEKR